MKKNYFVTAAVCLFLGAVTLLCYWQVLHHGFVEFDDGDYLYENWHVKSGLTWAGFVWAFTTNHASNWHPLTWLTHMVDCEIFGLNPAGHHLVNVLFHVANSILVFFTLRKLTGRLWPSAAVAALFAWHPLHVESVAWASERKDVLSTLFSCSQFGLMRPMPQRENQQTKKLPPEFWPQEPRRRRTSSPSCFSPSV